jgi:hypothetical protein
MNESGDAEFDDTLENSPGDHCQWAAYSHRAEQAAAGMPDNSDGISIS